MASELDIPAEPIIYPSVALDLVRIWRAKSDEMDANDDDLSAGIAAGLRNCANQLEGLVGVAVEAHNTAANGQT